MSSSDRTTFAVVKQQTGVVVRVGECEIDDLAIQCADDEDVIAPVDPGLRDDLVWRDGDEWRDYPPRPHPACQWTGSAWVDPRTPAQLAAETAAKWEAMRNERNALLAACDWTQVPDVPLSLIEKTAWAAYRKKLRDLPAKTADPANPAWPTPPNE